MSDLDVHVAAIARADAEAFGRWMAGAEHRLRLSLRRFAASVDVEAVLQETLLRIWQVAPRHRPDGSPDSLLRLAVRIARNAAVDELRRRRVEPVDDAVLAALADAGAVTPAEPDPLLRRALEACLRGLRGRPRQALELRLRASGEADAVLAARLDVKVNAFLQAVVRARQALVECLARRGIRIEEVWR